MRLSQALKVVDRHWLAAPLDLDRLKQVRQYSIRNDFIGSLVNQDLARLGCDLQPMGQVDRIPNGRVMVAGRLP